MIFDTLETDYSAALSPIFGWYLQPSVVDFTGGSHYGQECLSFTPTGLDQRQFTSASMDSVSFTSIGEDQGQFTAAGQRQSSFTN